MARQSQEGGSSHLLLGLGLGALVMYYADPQNGRRRRALAKDQYDHAAAKVKHGAEVALRDAAHRLSGTLVRARTALEKMPADDIVIAERVRSALGRCTSHPRALQVEVNQGRVTLKGDALATECERIVERVRRVAGVNGVEHELELHDTSVGVPVLQGEATRYGELAEWQQEKWSPAWRVIAGAVGTGLLVNAARRGGIRGIVVGLLASGLLARAGTNRRFPAPPPPVVH